MPQAQRNTSTSTPPIVGIVGGIGSGKSSVVRHVDGWNLRIIDADRIGHDLLHDSNVIKELRTAFGSSIFEDADSDQVSRSRLANVVFAEEDSEALKTLNAILHPVIRTEIHSQIRNAGTEVDAIILDAALLLEGGWAATCHWLIFIDTPYSVRCQRVLENRSWNQDELDRREARQLPVAEKRDRADFVVDNSGSIAAAAKQFGEVLTSILPKRIR